MNRFADRIVAAKRERDIGHSAADMDVRQVLPDGARGLDVVDGVVVVFFDPGRDGKNIRIKNDVFGRKLRLFEQQFVGARADFDAAHQRIGLAFLIESHDHCRRPVAAQQPCLAQEFGLAFLHADRIHHALALHAFEPGLDHLPLGGVDHDRDARDVRLRANEIQEGGHRLLRIQHGFVHVDVDDLRAAVDLAARDDQRLGVIAGENQARERLGAGDVGALADIDEQRVRADVERLQSGKPQLLFDDRNLARGDSLQRRGHCPYVRGRGTAAAAGDVQKSGLREFLQKGRGVLGRLVVFAKRVR